MLMSLYVVRLNKKGEDENYHFGYGAFEPLFIVIQTMFILTMNFVLAYFAVRTLLSGGAHIGVNAASTYTAISVIVCALVYVVLKRASKKYASPVLSAEAKSWLNDTMLSIAVLTAFLGIIFLSGTPLSFIVPYNAYSTKRGRTLYVVVHVYLNENRTVKTIDRIRKEMIRAIRKYWHYSDIDIVFTFDTTWIPLSSMSNN
jgi:predicted Co/Zn/Cd cation transporter (cation efflux family)